VELERFRKAFRRKGFREKVFTSREIEECEAKKDSLSSYAARFAVKEAFFKALADPTSKAVPWKQIETEGMGDTPTLRLSDALQARTPGMQVLVSLTHSGRMAAAVVLILPPLMH